MEGVFFISFYETMLLQQKQLQQKLTDIQKQLQQLPEGKLICTRLDRPLLLKNWGTWRVQSDDQCNDYHRDCQNQQAQERTYYVKSTLRYQVQLLLFQYRFCYLNDHIGRALLCQTAARCCCHISHIPTLISVSLPPIGSARSRPGAKALHRY